MIQFLSRLWHGAVFKPDPEREPVDPWAAWEEFQQRATELKESARAKHGAVRHIEAAQQSLVHSALAGSIPSRGVSS